LSVFYRRDSAWRQWEVKPTEPMQQWYGDGLDRGEEGEQQASSNHWWTQPFPLRGHWVELGCLWLCGEDLKEIMSGSWTCWAFLCMWHFPPQPGVQKQGFARIFWVASFVLESGLCSLFCFCLLTVVSCISWTGPGTVLNKYLLNEWMSWSPCPTNPTRRRRGVSTKDPVVLATFHVVVMSGPQKSCGNIQRAPAGLSPGFSSCSHSLLWLYQFICFCTIGE
jgi:hypothetical protein